MKNTRFKAVSQELQHEVRGSVFFQNQKLKKFRRCDAESDKTTTHFLDANHDSEKYQGTHDHCATIIKLEDMMLIIEEHFGLKMSIFDELFTDAKDKNQVITLWQPELISTAYQQQETILSTITLRKEWTNE